MKKRIPYICGFLLLTLTEVLIALFIHGGFIRNYLGDVIVVWVVYCFVQAIAGGRLNGYITAAGVMIFAFIIEFLQKINIVNLLGLGGIKFFRTLIGTSFSPVDLICYAAGSAIICAVIFIKRKITDKS
ncbi:MAG: DUF2809 domain-containing protein [Ruminococcus sp.]|nr:DUF2809 domain-containing protein [Ruminococcus sp.]